MKILLCVLVLLTFGLSVQTASVPKNVSTPNGDAMLSAYFKNETAKISENCLSNIHSLADWNAKKVEYRRELFEMLGLWPLPQKTDLKPVVTGKLDHPEFTVEKLQFQSLPGLYCTADVYVPKNLVKPAPAILYVCGHAQVKTNGVSYGNKTAYQKHGEWFARNGYVCLVLDTIQLGEISGIHHGTFRENMWWWNSRGYTPAGVEAWNGIRALDYLQSRSDVDPNRLGITGRSGGGAYSWYIAALDERIKVAAPVAGITDLQNHIVDNCVEGHCDCMFMANTFRWDYPQVAALIAPRPLLLGNSDKDKIFPLDGVLRVHAKLKRIYELNHAADKLGLLITEGPHQDTQDLQVPVFRWFNRFLKGEEPVIDIAATNLFPAEDLKVFNALPSDERTSKIHETFVPAAKIPDAPATAAEWKTLRDGWKTFFSERVFAAWPTNFPTPKLELISSSQTKLFRVRQFEFVSQENVSLPIYVVQSNNKPARLIVRVLDDTDAKKFSGIFQAIAQKKTLSANEFAVFEPDFSAEKNVAIAYVLPRGIGPTAWTSDEKKAPHIRRRFMLLGTTLDAMRVWDIRRAIESLRAENEFKKVPMELRSAGTMAVNALYAALFVPVENLQLTALPHSHRNGPDYLNVLKALDIPQTVAMVAEKTDVKLSETDAAFWKFNSDTAKNLGWKTLTFNETRKAASR